MSDPSPIRSRRFRRIAIALGVVVVIAAVAVWVAPSHHASASVRVLPRSMHCGLHQVPYRIIADELGQDVPVAAFDVKLRPDSFCQLEVTFVNDGSRSVHIDTATFPGMGQSDHAERPLEITQNGGRFNVEDTGTNDAGDAVLPIDQDLAAGESFSELFDLRTGRKRFIGDPHRIMTFVGLPHVRVSSAWIPASVDGSVNLQVRERT